MTQSEKLSTTVSNASSPNSSTSCVVASPWINLMRRDDVPSCPCS
eukprot:CAMPEP_0198130738 /NCGR_PEP_ID=MMETSP1442-20131203/54605_1 /TAXON_ID= /ORGANISM="Craspedostauros australis, Strain CCMP3328" /LENGTH=44 /DNA_ID= /DNA_START= /DNA_END= /DNA_ORIENTATION=